MLLNQSFHGGTRYETSYSAFLLILAQNFLIFLVASVANLILCTRDTYFLNINLHILLFRQHLHLPKSEPEWSAVKKKKLITYLINLKMTTSTVLLFFYFFIFWYWTNICTKFWNSINKVTIHSRHLLGMILVNISCPSRIVESTSFYFPKCSFLITSYMIIWPIRLLMKNDSLLLTSFHSWFSIPQSNDFQLYEILLVFAFIYQIISIY